MIYDIFIAISKNDIYYIKNHPEEYNEKGYDNWIPLHSACWNNKLEIVKILVESNLIDINKKTKSSQQTPLHFVCERSRKYDNYKLIKYLINNGANHLEKDICNDTPLDELKYYNINIYNKIIKYLKFKKMC